MNPARRLFVVANPRAGRGRALRAIEETREVFAAGGCELEVTLTDLRDNLEAMCEGFLESAARSVQNSRGRMLDTLMAGWRYVGKREYRRKSIELYMKWPNRVYIHNKDMANKILGGCLAPYVESGGKAPSPMSFNAVRGK